MQIGQKSHGKAITVSQQYVNIQVVFIHTCITKFTQTKQMNFTSVPNAKRGRSAGLQTQVYDIKHAGRRGITVGWLEHFRRLLLLELSSNRFCSMNPFYISRRVTHKNTKKEKASHLSFGFFDRLKIFAYRGFNAITY